MTMHCLVLWRHGESQYNASARMQGQLDPPLTETGHGQAEQAAATLAALAPDVLVSSDLSRATATAGYLQRRCGVPARPDTRLRETHLGRWQGRTADEVQACWPAAIPVWRQHPEWTPPGGEARTQAAARAGRLVAELDEADHVTAVLCTHGGLIAGLTPRLLGLPVGAWSAFGGIGNCRWVVLRRRDGIWRLAAYNTAGPE